MMTNDLLFELGTEELPSGAVKPLSKALVANVLAALEKAELKYGDVSVFATPRRLGFMIQALQTQQASQSIVRRGPAWDSTQALSPISATPAVIGFAKSCGVALDALTLLQTEKGCWVCYEAMTPSVPTTDLLPAILTDAIDELPIDKPMRWGDGAIEFVRPVHWVVLLFGQAVVPTTILGLQTDRYTRGHRFYHPEPLEIVKPAMYASILRDACVEVDFDVRRSHIIKTVEAIAAQNAAVAVMPDTLLDEVTSIVEYPHALLARFDTHFLEVPAEALIAAMQVHQKCFALRDNTGQLLPCFITVANIESLDPERVILGNEKVMRARLSDARFFYDKDRQHGLSHYAEGTKSVVYQAQLGSLADKAERLQGILETSLALPLGLQITDVLRAASLSQCDLMTGMVGEFPELQGLMGYYYALHDGEPVPVATALKEQYMPRFSGDTLPSSPLGLALSIADRMDTLVGAFAIGQKPTGVKDPFKLRRHAIALARLLIEAQTPISLADLIQSTKAQYSKHLKSLDTVDTLLPVFVLERLHAFYQAQGVPVACVDAARARQEDCLFDLDQRIQALVQFMQLQEAQSLAAASKRVNNLLQHATLPLETATIDPDLLLEQAEKSLFERILTIEKLILPAYEHRQYTCILKHLASLRDVVDVFFEEVLVLDKNLDLQQNRLALLKRLQTILQGVAVIAML